MRDGVLAPKLSRREWYPATTATSLEPETLLSAADLNPMPMASRPARHTSSAWSDAVREQLEHVVALKDDWDTYGSPPPTASAVAGAVTLLRDLVPLALPVPRITATAESGVTIEWFTAAFEFVVEVEEDGRSAIVMFRDRVTGDSAEGDMNEHPDVVSKAIHRLQVSF